MRIYDPRVGRFLSVGPLTKDYPYYTPYSFAGNKPIWAIDLDGAEELIPIFGVDPRMFSLNEAIETGVDVGTKASPFEEASVGGNLSSVRVSPSGMYQELPFNWTSFNAMPVLPRPDAYTYGRGPLLKAPDQNTITQQVPEKAPQPAANPQR